MGINSAGPDSRRKMLRYRAWHRGTKEADLLIGPFADAHLSSFNETSLAEFEKLLEIPDDQLTSWILHAKPLTAEIDNSLLQCLRDFNIKAVL